MNSYQPSFTRNARVFLLCMGPMGIMSLMGMYSPNGTPTATPTSSAMMAVISTPTLPSTQPNPTAQPAVMPETAQEKAPETVPVPETAPEPELPEIELQSPAEARRRLEYWQERAAEIRAQTAAVVAESNYSWHTGYAYNAPQTLPQRTPQTLRLAPYGSCHSANGVPGWYDAIHRQCHYATR